LLVFVLLATAILAVPAFAQTVANGCAQNEYNAFNGSTVSCTSTPSSLTLGCTANDVSISQIPQNTITILSGGQNNPPRCFQNGNFSFTGDFDILTTANAANAGGRDNVGLYLSTKQACSSTVTTDCNPPVKFGPGGKVTSTAICGTCSDNIISPLHTSTGASCTAGTAGCLGSDNYHEYDNGVFVDNTLPDNCGDTSSTDNSSKFGAGQEGVTIEVQNMFCGGQTCTVGGVSGLLLNYCTTWQTPGSAIACHSDSPAFNYPFDPATGKPEAVPGTQSKCNCATVCLPVTPISVTATATKSCTTAITTTASNSCDEGAEGLDAATYTITLTPTVSAGDSIVDAICDSVYGSIVGSPAGCAPLASGVSTTCVAGTTITGGSSYTCTFTAPAIGELTSVTDTVTFYGHASLNPSVTFNATTNSVEVHSEDAPSSATVTKGLGATLAACATERYTVDVKNTGGADETLTLSALHDTAFGNIIPNTASDIIATTCAVPQTIIPGATYSCTFDAQICGTLVNGCFSHDNKVTGTLTGDDPAPNADVVTQTANTLTVQECLTATVTSH